jgi:hypothetical protein
MPGWMEAFVVVSTVAIVVQMCILLGIFLQFREIHRHTIRVTEDLQSKLDPILIRMNRLLEDSSDRLASIMGDAAEITRLARGQAQKVDRVFTEAVERMRIQVIRTDHIITGALEVIEEAGSRARKTLLRPVLQASAFVKGLGVGLDFIRGHRRPHDHGHTHQDEELFI